MSLSLSLHRFSPAALRGPVRPVRKTDGPDPTGEALPALVEPAGPVQPPPPPVPARGWGWWLRRVRPAPRPLVELPAWLLADLGAPEDVRALAADREAQRAQSREWLRMGVLPHGAPW